MILGCFYCGVDSTQILLIFAVLIGGLVFGMMFIGISFALKSRDTDREAVKYQVFEAEKRH